MLCDVYLYRFIDYTWITSGTELFEICKDTPICRQALLLYKNLAQIDSWMYAFISFACYIFRLLYEIYLIFVCSCNIQDNTKELNNNYKTLYYSGTFYTYTHVNVNQFCLTL